VAVGRLAISSVMTTVFASILGGVRPGWLASIVEAIEVYGTSSSFRVSKTSPPSQA